MWFRRQAAAEHCLIPWIELSSQLEGKTVLEYGCGAGAVACALAPRVGRHIGIDIDAGAVEYARHQVELRGYDNVRLEAVPADRTVAAVEAHRDEIDVFLFYAVLEHMTVSERLEMLRVARDVVRRDGAIVVCEAPNRLVAWDWHSSQLPFFAQLPDDLALLYADRSERRDFVDSVKAGPEALTRFGRGVSFHEFELVFGDLRRHVIASNWEPMLFPERDIHVEELGLARLMARARPDLPPCFSRYWIDTILSPEPLVGRPPTFLWPWSFDTRQGANVAWTADDAVEMAGAGSRLRVEPPVGTRRLVVGFLAEPKSVEIVATSIDTGACQRQHVASSGEQLRYASLNFADPHHAFDVSLDSPAYVNFVGYEA